MEYFIVIYRVTIDGTRICYGKAGVASKELYSDWDKVEREIRKGYGETYHTARTFKIEAVKATRVSFQKYVAFINAAAGSLN